MKENESRNEIVKNKYLTVKEFYNQLQKNKTKKKSLVLKTYLENLDKNYNIIEVEDPVVHECSKEYPESYIVNQSSKRFNNEIKNSHFIAHWQDLCQYPEVASQLRFVYNLINLKKDKLINILDELSIHNLKKKSFNDTIIEKNSTDFKKIAEFLGIENIIDRIKIENQSSNYKKIQNTNNNIDDENNSYVGDDDKSKRKMLINFSLIINLENEYSRNLLSCPLDKVILAKRHSNVKNKTFNFVCHKNNMIERLKTNKLCLSVWLIKIKKEKNKKKQEKQEKQKQEQEKDKITEWITKIKIGTAYLSDTFPGENGTINNFIKDIINLGYSNEAALYLKKIKGLIKNGYFYAIELNNPKIKDINNLSKKTKTKTKRII